MGKVVTQKTTWTCDRCAHSVEQECRPSTPSDAWGHLRVEQDAGFDWHGVPWAPRMREPVLLCGACMEKVVAILNNIEPEESRRGG